MVVFAGVAIVPNSSVLRMTTSSGARALLHWTVATNFSLSVGCDLIKSSILLRTGTGHSSSTTVMARG